MENTSFHRPGLRLEMKASEQRAVNLPRREAPGVNRGLNAERGHMQVWLQLSVFTVPPRKPDPNGWWRQRGPI